MGTELVAFIEYDESELDFGLRSAQRSPATLPAPFTEGLVDTVSVTEKGGMYTGSKDYRFFAAIAGVRNDSGIEPLIRPRGLPQNPSVPLRLHVEEYGRLGDYGNGWLTLAEIKAAMAHQQTDLGLISFETQTILFIMANLESRLVGRVRLVFGFES